MKDFGEEFITLDTAAGLIRNLDHFGQLRIGCFRVTKKGGNNASFVSVGKFTFPPGLVILWLQRKTVVFLPLESIEGRAMHFMYLSRCRYSKALTV